MNSKQKKDILDRYLKKILCANVYDVARESKLEFAPIISGKIGKKIFYKREDQQETFSFKIRGAYNKISHLSSAERLRGVIAASAGNHGQGVSLAAKKLKIKSTIVMPQTTPSMKVVSVKRLGSDVVLHGDSYSDAFEEARKIARLSRKQLIHPFDDMHVIAGQGTIGMEIIRQMSEPIDAIFIAVGGGGLISGIGCYIKSIRPDIKIIGVQTEDSDAMMRSIEKGKRIKLKHVGIFSDGTAVKQVGTETFKLAKIVVDDFCIVSADEICAATRDIFEDTRTIQEPAGAMALAGLKKYVLVNGNKQKLDNLVAITCGANVNFDRLRIIAERSELGENKEALLAISLPEQRGSFLKLCETLGNRHITEFNYRMEDSSTAIVFAGIEVKDSKEKTKTLKALKAHGFKVFDLSDDEISKSHIRHMVGGKSNLTDNEKLFKFDFPERPGALTSFLSKMHPSWNISLFNYKHNGTDSGKILIGLQVPEDDRRLLEKFLKQLGYEYTNESKNLAYKLFLNKKSLR